MKVPHVEYLHMDECHLTRSAKSLGVVEKVFCLRQGHEITFVAACAGLCLRVDGQDDQSFGVIRCECVDSPRRQTLR